MHSRMFLNSRNDSSKVAPVVSVSRKLEKARSASSVHWSNRGIPTGNFEIESILLLNGNSYVTNKLLSIV